MTSPFMQSLSLQKISDFLETQNQQPSLRILDAGTGLGYINFALYKLLCVLNYQRSHLVGIDLYEEVIQRAKRIDKELREHKILEPSSNELVFRRERIQDLKTEPFELIHIGFGVPREFAQ